MKFALKGKGNKREDGDKTPGEAGDKAISGTGNSRGIGGANIGEGIGLKLGRGIGHKLGGHKLGGHKLGGGKLGGGTLTSGLRGNNAFDGSKSNDMFGSGSESESDEESRFKKMVAAKAAKFTREVTDLGEQTVEIDDEIDHIDATSQPKQRKLKYLDQLLETNRKRKQEQLAAQMNFDTGDSYVFESEEYKAKKQKVEEEEDELETNSGTFYAKVLDAKMGRGEHKETKSAKSIARPRDGNVSENINEITNIPNDKHNPVRTSGNVGLPGKDRPKEIKHKSSSNHTILSTNALAILKGLIATKITKEDIARYREEYFSRMSHK